MLLLWLWGPANRFHGVELTPCPPLEASSRKDTKTLKRHVLEWLYRVQTGLVRLLRDGDMRTAWLCLSGVDRNVIIADVEARYGRT